MLSCKNISDTYTTLCKYLFSVFLNQVWFVVFFISGDFPVLQMMFLTLPGRCLFKLKVIHIQFIFDVIINKINDDKTYLFHNILLLIICGGAASVLN